ncbi:GDP-mannose 4,6-dehydratase [bacterium]|nr:GDP-mannose 4,6-dehydratase [bacterium]
MAVILVTGAAGFIGSHLAERLLATGATVRGVDCFTDYYARDIKERNVELLRASDSFSLVEEDLATAPLEPLLDGVDAVCHMAAQAGVRASWGSSFETYLDCNVRATQRLLEAVKEKPLSRFVYASSSSVYGQTDDLPMRERGLTCPVSPYGVTKLAGEHLAVLYHRNYGLPTVSLRFFTVYGPRQRPDMAFHKFLRAGLAGEAIEVYGNGAQTRDFTYIDDIVQGIVAALENGPPGEVFNLGGGGSVTLNGAIDAAETVLGRPIERRYVSSQRGDVSDTRADNTKAREELGFTPATSLEVGLKRELDWIADLYNG